MFIFSISVLASVTFALTEYPRDKFKLRNVVPAVDIISVKGVANKVKTCHGKTFFIGGVIEKRIILSNMSSAYHCIVGIYPAHINKVKGKASWHYDYLLAIGAFIVKSSSKIKIVRFISCRSTHSAYLQLYYFLTGEQFAHLLTKLSAGLVIFNITLFAVKINGVDLC